MPLTRFRPVKATRVPHQPPIRLSPKATGNKNKKIRQLLLLSIFSCVYIVLFFTTVLTEQKQQQKRQQKRQQKYDTATQQPEVSVSSKEEFFSACLLVMDDNIRLREWIAYHYHVMPLRKLIITVDPRSKHSPRPILDLFRRELPNLDITEWNSTDDSGEDSYNMRQKLFLESCLTHLHQEGYHWTMCIDPDEFVALNPLNRAPRAFKHVTKRTSFRSPGAVMEFITKGKKLSHRRKVGKTLLFRECAFVPRVLYGARDLEDLTTNSSFIDPYRLDTVRWRFHASVWDKQNGFGRALLDVSGLGPLMPIRVQSPHRMLFRMCGPSSPEITIRNPLPFRVNHYLGSWEQYVFRDTDPRRGGDKSREDWEFRSQKADIREDTTHLWLDGFVEHVGTERAMRLLQGAGLPRNDEKTVDGWAFDPNKFTMPEGDPRREEFLAFVHNKLNLTT